MASFQKVVVYGYNLGSGVLKVRNGGELSVPTIAEVKDEEFSKTFIQQDKITPESIRFEFDTENAVEVYEIEAY